MAESILANSVHTNISSFQNEIQAPFDASSYSTPSSSGGSYQPAVSYSLNIPNFLSSVEITTPAFNIPVVETGGYGYCNVQLQYGKDAWNRPTHTVYSVSGPNQNNVAESYTLIIPSLKLVLYSYGDGPLWTTTQIPFTLTFNICQASYTVPAVIFVIKY